MEWGNHLRIGAALAALVLVGSCQGTRLAHIRESEAFFRWINAAAVNERVLQQDQQRPESGDDRDDALWAALVAKTDPLLADEAFAPLLADVVVPGGDASDPCTSKLCRMASNPDYDDALWQLTRSEDLAGERAQFLELVREDRLAYAQGIPYAEAQKSGANVNLFNLFFGFRKVAANFLWLEVDRFWHQGMYWRMIPLMKTCVALDPNFVDAYLLGAWHMAYNATAKMPETPQRDKEWHPRYGVCVGEKEKYFYFAVDFLKDGIRNNPRDYRLYFDLGFAVYRQKLEDYPNAVKYLSEAVRHPHQRWVPRQLFEALEKNRQFEDALRGWEDYNARFPDTTDVAPRFILRNQGHIAERTMDDQLKTAAESSDPAAREAALKAAAESETQARRIWMELAEPFALARLLRIDAIKLAEQGRYLEAVALLDRARNESNDLYWEASDLIIDFKQRGGIPLSLSEKKAVLRKEQGDTCRGMPAEAAPAA